nr:MAG TPA: hypothetical protein [Caudoviricetes sp.]
MHEQHCDPGRGGGLRTWVRVLSGAVVAVRPPVQKGAHGDHESRRLAVPVHGCAWVWCSYLLAYLGREQIAEQLSGKAVTEIIAVILAYAIKSLVENLSKNNNWPDKARKDEKDA